MQDGKAARACRVTVSVGSAVRDEAPSMVTAGKGSDCTVTCTDAEAVAPRNVVTLRVNKYVPPVASLEGAAVRTTCVRPTSWKLLKSDTMSDEFAASFSASTAHMYDSARPDVSRVPLPSKRSESHSPRDEDPDMDTGGATGFCGNLTGIHWREVDKIPPGAASTMPRRSTSSEPDALGQVKDTPLVSLTGRMRACCCDAMPITTCRVEVDVQPHSAPVPKLMFSKTEVHAKAPELPNNVPLLGPSNVTMMLYPVGDSVADSMLGGVRRGATTMATWPM